MGYKIAETSLTAHSSPTLSVETAAFEQIAESFLPLSCQSLSLKQSPQILPLCSHLMQLAQSCGSDLTALLHQAAQAIRTTLEIDDCWIVLREQVDPDFQPLSPSLEASARSPLSASVQAQLTTRLMAATPLALNDLQHHPDWDTLIHALRPPSGCFTISSVQAVLAMGLTTQPTLPGSLMLVRSQPYVWSDQDLSRIQAIAASLAFVLSHSHDQQRLQRHTDHQYLIRRIAQQISHSTQPEHLLPFVLTELSQTLTVSRSFVLLLKQNQPLQQDRTQARVDIVCEWSAAASSLQEITPSTPSQSTQTHRSFNVSTCTLLQQALDWVPALTLLQGRTLSSTSIDCPETHYSPSSSRRITLADASQLASIFELQAFPTTLLVPMEHQGTLLGFMVLQQHQPRIWYEDEQILSEIVAAQLSTTWLQIQTLQQVKSLVAERTAQLQRSMEVQGKLYEQTRKQVDQLRHLNQLKDEFLSTISHELLTPLTSMKHATRMMRQPQLAPERRETYLNILEQQCTQETELINDLLALQKLETQAATIQLQNLDLQHTLPDWTAAWADLWHPRKLTFQMDLPARSLPMQTDPDSLQRILRELLTNASKYSQPTSTVQLQVAIAVPSNHDVKSVVIKLINLGSGIAPEELPHIFDKFRRGRGMTAQAIQGTGLGLTLVKALVQHLNGRIQVSSTPLPDQEVWQTCFTVELPQLYNQGPLEGMLDSSELA